MASSSTFSPSFLAFFFLFLLSATAAAGSSPAATTHLHFYFKEEYQGPTQTSFLIATLNKTSSTFGNVRVYDNPVRDGPDSASKLLGRVQGMAVTASLAADQAMLTMQNFIFTAGEYNGSSLALDGRADPTASSIERPIVGGSGRFRLARGYAVSRIIQGSSEFIIVENDVYLL